MVIRETGFPIDPTPASEGSDAKKPRGHSSTARTEDQTDRVTISGLAAGTTPPSHTGSDRARVERIQQLSADIQAGRYTVNSQQVASQLIKTSLIDHMA